MIIKVISFQLRELMTKLRQKNNNTMSNFFPYVDHFVHFENIEDVFLSDCAEA